jgi:hypothetical protein
MRNPYITGRWVSGPEFYGRQPLTEAILRGPDDHLWVMGLRRTGKTSLLRQIELSSRQDGSFLPLFWDLQGCQAPDDLGLALYEGVEEAAGDLTALGESISDWESLDLFALLKALAQLAREDERRLLLLVDEAECLNHLARADPHTLQRLRRTLQRGPQIRTVLVSSKRLSALHELCQDWETSPFLHGFALRYLSHLTPEAATGLIHQRQAARPVQAVPGLVAKIRQLTGGHPYLLQLLCSRLFSNGSLRPIADESLAFVEAQMMGFLLNDFAALSAPERAILRAVSSDEPLPADAHPTYLHGLVGLGILRHEGDGYAIGNDFFARWLREQADWETRAEVSAEGTLTVYTQSELEPVLEAVRENRLALAEMEQMLDAIRRALVVWQREGLPGTERLGRALEKPGGPRHKLEATLPLLPGALAYKVEWGGEVRDLLAALRAAAIHNREVER